MHSVAVYLSVITMQIKLLCMRFFMFVGMDGIILFKECTGLLLDILENFFNIYILKLQSP